MKKYYIIILLCLLGLGVIKPINTFAATKTVDLTPKGKKKSTVYVITKAKLVQGNSKTVTNYKYNKKGLLTQVKIGKDASQKISYNSKNKITQMVTTGEGPKQTLKCVYNKKGKISKYLLKTGNGKYETICKVSYNKKGVATKFDNNNIYYSGSNVTKTKEPNGTIITYTYDKNKNVSKCLVKYEESSSENYSFTNKYSGNKIVKRTQVLQTVDEFGSSTETEVCYYTTKKISVPTSLKTKIINQQRKLINDWFYVNPDLYDFGQIAAHV